MVKRNKFCAWVESLDLAVVMCGFEEDLYSLPWCTMVSVWFRIQCGKRDVHYIIMQINSLSFTNTVLVTTKIDWWNVKVFNKNLWQINNLSFSTFSGVRIKFPMDNWTWFTTSSPHNLSLGVGWDRKHRHKKWLFVSFRNWLEFFLEFPGTR